MENNSTTENNGTGVTNSNNDNNSNNSNKVNNGKNGANKLGTLLGKSKWISLLAVLVLYISSGILIVVGIIKLIYILKLLFNAILHPAKIDTVMFSAHVINIIELYLLSIIFYIFAIGLYKLFVGKFNYLSWYKVESLDELKAELAKAIVIFLAVFLVQKIVEWKDPQQLLISGLVICLISAILTWFAISFHNNSHSKR